jgi:hypothetical protein
MRLRIAVGRLGRLFDGLVEGHLIGSWVPLCVCGGGHFILAFLLGAACANCSSSA